MHKRSHSSLKSHFHLRVPRKTCAVIRICSTQSRSAVCVQIAGALELIGPTLRCCWKQRSMHNAQASLVHASGIQSVTLVVFVFIAAAAQPANSTRVITCCNQQSRLLWSPSTSVCQVQAAAAHTQRRTVTEPQSRLQPPQSERPSAQELLLAVIRRSRSHSQSPTHLICFRVRCPPSATNQSCSSECYMGRAAAAVCYMRPSSHSWSHTLARGYLAAAIIHTKWNPSGHTHAKKKPQKSYT